MSLPLAENADRCYREMLYYRGNVPSKEKDAVIPDDIIEREAERGFEQSDRYLRLFSRLNSKSPSPVQETFQNRSNLVLLVSALASKEVLEENNG
jgi:hypothetical protein